MKKLITILTVLAIATIAIPAFSAVENVKVGGDMTAYGIFRNNFDFIKNSTAKDDYHWFQTSTRIYVSADLTDNVSAMVRLINERDWATGVGAGIAGGTIDMDLANVKIADLLTPGLSLTVGRQEILLGEGLVVGSAYSCAAYPIGLGGLGIGEDLGLQKAFDAVKLDYSVAAFPVSASLFMAKLVENYGGLNTAGAPGDTDLYALSVLWKPEYFSLEEYYVWEKTGFANEGTDRYDIGTIGIRATATIPAVTGLSLKGEYAKQNGKVDTFGLAESGVEGWAGYLGAAYEFGVSMKPKVSLTYNYFSGRDAADTKAKNWIPIAPSNIADRVGMIAYPALFSAGESTNTLVAESSGLVSWKLGLGIQPLEKLSLSLNVFNLTAAEKYTAGEKKAIGNEYDLNATWAYTSDLSFGLDYGILQPGKLIKDAVGAAVDTSAWQTIVSMKLAF